MGLYLRFEINTVDSRRNFVEQFEINLKYKLKSENLQFKYYVAGYSSASNFIQSIEANPSHLPILIVADSAAREPSVEDGLFSKIKKIVPRCLTVFYSASMEGRDELEQNCLVNRVVRAEPRKGFSKLLEVVTNEIRQINLDLEYALIRQYADAVARTRDSDISSVADDEENEYAPSKVLIEMARGTEKGKSYLLKLHPESPYRIGNSLEI